MNYPSHIQKVFDHALSMITEQDATLREAAKFAYNAFDDLAVQGDDVAAQICDGAAIAHFIHDLKRRQKARERMAIVDGASNVYDMTQAFSIPMLGRDLNIHYQLKIIPDMTVGELRALDLKIASIKRRVANIYRVIHRLTQMAEGFPEEMLMGTVLHNLGKDPARLELPEIELEAN